MNLLVTGAHGMLGSDLCHVMTESHSVTATDIDDMDVRDLSKVIKTIEELKPDLVLHLAAITDVDYCERFPDEAFRTNAIGTYNVALACQRIGAPLLYVSTISVFDGEKCSSYTEFDTPNPVSKYSQSKYEGEKIVASLCSRHYTVRAGWMFGGGKADKKFVARILELAREREVLKVVDDKFGSPTYTIDLSLAIDRLIQSGYYGLFHMVNTGQACSRYELAKFILEKAGLTSCEVVPVSSAEFPLPAPRPRMEAARNYRLELMSLDWMRSWQEALAQYIETTLTCQG